MQPSFQRMSMVTQHLIAFELLQKKVFKKGELILPQNKRSNLNTLHREYMKKNTTSIMK